MDRKLTTPTLIGLALALSQAPVSLAFSDACRTPLVYCGSTLMMYNGYTQIDLRASLHLTPADLSPAALAAYDDPANALFRCVDGMGGVRMEEYCMEGCMGMMSGDACGGMD